MIVANRQQSLPTAKAAFAGGTGKTSRPLSQEGNDFDKHFGKFRSLWAELEMLWPATIDPDVLNQRREQDYGLCFAAYPPSKLWRPHQAHPK